jgi:membrane-associated phospholipid phosphatase
MGENARRHANHCGAAACVEGGAMKMARGAFIGRDAVEAHPCESQAGYAETLGAATESAVWEEDRRWLAVAWRACGALEWVTMVYLLWTLALLCLCRRNIPHAARSFAIHCALAVGIIATAWMGARSRNRAMQFARHWYPLPLYIFFFEELQGLVHAIFPGWFDRWLISFDYNFAGVHPAAWVAGFATPALNDFMQFSYMTYFLFLVILPAILYLQNQRTAFWTVMTSTAIAHYSVYVIAILFPVESPYFALASLHLAPLTGGAFTTTIEFIERFGRVHGAAFPSAHVAGSTVALLAARRYKPWLFWICLPFFLSMCVATVYGRYHYVADVLAGIVVGALGGALGQRILQCKGAVPPLR